MTTASAPSEPPAEAKAFYDFCEALLRLEWPGRRVAVTPAPFLEVVQDVCDAVGLELDGRSVVDITVGPLGDDDPAFVCFRAKVCDHVAQRNWPAVAAQILEQARHDFARWPTKN